jgi:hypothetical protein
MRLAYSDTEKRLPIKLDKSMAGDDSLGGIMTFGSDNLYPQTIEALIAGSPTAKACSGMYARFLTGFGFQNEAINDVVVGKDERGKDITLLQLLRAVAQSASKNKGFYIHVNKTLENKVKTAKITPFKYCRFNKRDDLGFCSKVGVYSNWDKSIKFDRDKVKFYDNFTNDDAAFAAQINKAGTIDKYKGQIYTHFFDPEYLYPLSMVDSVYLDCDTEAQVAIFRNTEIRNGFQATTIMLMQEPEDPKDADEIKKKLSKMKGADASRITLFWTNRDENGKLVKDEHFITDTIPSPINDKLFESWEAGLANNIRKSFNGMPAVLIDYEQGKLSGTSGEAIIQATTLYNELTRDDRAALSSVFKEIFSRSVFPELENNLDWSIKPLELYVIKPTV